MPTVFREKGYRFYFFSREESRCHIHVSSEKGEAKIWMEPEIKVAETAGFNDNDVRQILAIVSERKEEINEKWNKHFSE